MASHWGHKIKLNRRVNGKNWNESKADYGVGGGGGGEQVHDAQNIVSNFN